MTLTLQQILRNDFLSRQKQWELDQARSAPENPEAHEEDEREAVSSSIAGESAECVQVYLS